MENVIEVTGMIAFKKAIPKPFSKQCAESPMNISWEITSREVCMY